MDGLDEYHGADPLSVRRDGVMPSRCVVAVALWLGLMAGLTDQYARLWVHPLPLWAHAARLAPLKPRPWLHVGIGLVLIGRYADAGRSFDHAALVAGLPHVPAWDRAVTRELVAQNRTALETLRQRMARDAAP